MKIFIIESPNPNDLLESRNERASLENMCSMFNHQTASFFTYSKLDFENIIKYISKVELVEGEKLCLHFSCHGNSEGVAIGPDFVKWKQFAKALLPVFNNSAIGKETFIILSACGANEQKITKEINDLTQLQREALHFPNYFFVYNQDEVSWSDALLCWSILYHQLSKLDVIDRTSVQNILKNIDKFGSLKYFRWDEGEMKYLKFTPNSRS